MSINQRFEIIINSLFSGKKSAFAARIGVRPSVVDNIVGKRKGNPSYEVLEKTSAIAEIRMEWLIRGEGEPFWKNSEDRNEVHSASKEINMPFIEQYIKEKDDKILEQALEIGQLRERIRALEKVEGNLGTSPDTLEGFLEEVISSQEGEAKTG